MWHCKIEPGMQKDGFQKHPENINRNGRPKSRIKSIISDLKSQGYEKYTQNDLIDIFITLMDCSEDELKRIIKDKKQPIVVKNTAEALLNDKRLDILEKIQNRVFWQPTQQIKQDVSISDVIVLKPQNNLKNKK